MVQKIAWFVLMIKSTLNYHSKYISNRVLDRFSSSIILIVHPCAIDKNPLMSQL